MVFLGSTALLTTFLNSGRAGSSESCYPSGMAIAAQAPNVRCKISDLGMGDNNWTVDSIHPYVLRCIETFGVERSFFSSNWPVDWLFSSYDTLVDAYTEITADFTRDEQETLFSKNAKALYNI